MIRAKRAAPKPETRNRHSRGQAGGPAHTGTVSGAGYVPGNNGNRGPLAYEINGGALPAAGPSERGEATAASLPALPVHLPSMPYIYGRPEPRLDQDNGKPRLTINELIRLNMIDLRELAACYNISHDDMVSLKKQEIIFSILKAHTERGGIIYAYGSLEILPDSYGFLRSPRIPTSPARTIFTSAPARSGFSP